MEAVYQVAAPIPGIGAEPGDIVLVELEHPRYPLLVVKQYGEDHLPALLAHIGNLELVSAHSPLAWPAPGR
jgi:hypothetical protein